MKHVFKIFFFLFISWNVISIHTANSQSVCPANYVNPLLGTEFFGHTYPGASLPFAMVHASPDTGTKAGAIVPVMFIPKTLSLVLVIRIGVAWEWLTEAMFY